jgi:two-component system, LuxR family, sensor kinase FixL
MSWITVVWSINAGACLTLAAVYLVVWCKQRESWVHLAFSCSALAGAALTAFELALLRAHTVEEYTAILRWTQLPIWTLVVSLVVFVRLYFRAGRLWLAWSVCGLRTLALILNFVFVPNLSYREITHLKQLSWWGGEAVSVPVGVTNSWILVAQLSSLLLIVFFLDATITVWRQGYRGRGLRIGGGLTLFSLIAVGQTLLVVWGIIQIPFLACFAIVGLLAAMGYELSSEVLRAGQLAGALRLSEAALRKTEEDMEIAADAAGLALWTWDIARDQVWLSHKARAVFGLSPSEKLNTERIRSLIHPEDRELVRNAVKDSLETGAEGLVEYRVVLPDGAFRWVARRSRTVFDRNGKPVTMHGILFDITERKQAELEAARQRHELAHLSRVTMLGELSGSLAHELNQPLTAILSNTQAAQKLLADGAVDTDELREILAEIVDEDRHAAEVIHRLRALFRKGEVGRHSTDLDMNEIVQDVLKLMRSDLLNQDVTVHTELGENLPVVEGDRVQLQQVLLNLVLNGCEAMADYDSSERQLFITSGVENGAVRVSVTDRGGSIPEEKMAEVFEPFFTTKSEGMGLGLSICRTIIKAHRGDIWATNNAEGGATFHFSLPISSQGVAHAA